MNMSSEAISMLSLPDWGSVVKRLKKWIIRIYTLRKFLCRMTKAHKSYASFNVMQKLVESFFIHGTKGFLK